MSLLKPQQRQPLPGTEQAELVDHQDGFRGQRDLPLRRRLLEHAERLHPLLRDARVHQLVGLSPGEGDPMDISLLAVPGTDQRLKARRFSNTRRADQYAEPPAFAEPVDCLGLLAREREPRLLYSLPDLVAVERVAPVGGGLLRQGNERPLLRDMQRRGQLGLPRLLDVLPVELGFLPVLAHPFGHEALGHGVDVGGLFDAMRDQAAQRGGADIADPDHGAVLQLLLQPGQRRLIRFLQPFLRRERRHRRAVGLHARIVPAERLGLSPPGGEVGHVVLAQLFP